MERCRAISEKNVVGRDGEIFLLMNKHHPGDFSSWFIELIDIYVSGDRVVVSSEHSVK